MVIAVTYDVETEEVGQHFGHATHFKLYEVENKKILDSAVVQPFGQGHEAVVETMIEYSVAVVICQGIGESAIAGLQQVGISVCPNVTGAADDAVEAFMNGTLQIQMSATCGCDHGSEGHSCCGSCGSCH